MKKKLIAFTILVSVIAIVVAMFLKTAYVIPIAMYHSIDYNYKETKLSLSPEDFKAQMEFLSRNHYNVVGLDEIISYMRKKGKIPPKTIAITLDDGFYNNYKYAYPVLKKLRLPATIFVIVEKIGKPGWLGWKELKEMSDSGIIIIGSHTISHAWLPDADDKKLKYELTESKDVLEKGLGKRVDFLCYPLGALDDRVKRCAEEAGYKAAVTTNPGRSKPNDDIYAIKRIKISRTSHSIITFWTETSGYYTWVKERRDHR